MNKEYTELNNYRIFDYKIPNIFLDFKIEEKKVIVKTELKLIKTNLKANKLILDGVDINVKKISIVIK